MVFTLSSRTRTIQGRSALWLVSMLISSITPTPARDPGTVAARPLMRVWSLLIALVRPVLLIAQRGDLHHSIPFDSMQYSRPYEDLGGEDSVYGAYQAAGMAASAVPSLI